MKGESAVDNIKRRLSGGRQISSDVPCGWVSGLSPSVSFLGLGCSLPGIHIHGEGDHVSRSRATKKGRAESREELESSHLAKKRRQAALPASEGTAPPRLRAQIRPGRNSSSISVLMPGT